MAASDVAARVLSWDAAAVDEKPELSSVGKQRSGAVKGRGALMACQETLTQGALRLMHLADLYWHADLAEKAMLTHWRVNFECASMATILEHGMR